MKENALGVYLRDRRTKIDPLALGFAPGRRRTSGLRREEVAQRANMSATWYTWLEQGRGGAPSADVLDRIAEALMMTEAEREHLYLLGLGRPPATRVQTTSGITPRLQRVLDLFDRSPAMIKNCMWDILAWNNATEAVMMPFGQVPPEQRNSLKMMFLNPLMRETQLNWDDVARYLVETFRADSARAGQDVSAFVEELSRQSEDFARFWRENNVRTHTAANKTIRHPKVGLLTFELSAFAVDGRPDLSMTVYNAATPADEDKVRALIEAHSLSSTKG